MFVVSGSRDAGQLGAGKGRRPPCADGVGRGGRSSECRRSGGRQAGASYHALVNGPAIRFGCLQRSQWPSCFRFLLTPRRSWVAQVLLGAKGCDRTHPQFAEETRVHCVDRCRADAGEHRGRCVTSVTVASCNRASLLQSNNCYLAITTCGCSHARCRGAVGGRAVRNFFGLQRVFELPPRGQL